MAVATKHNPVNNESFNDITGDLSSLQFESALSEDEKDLLHLRKNIHALTVCACAQAVYFSVVINKIRQIKMQLCNPEERKATRLLQVATSRDPLVIGIIGCGRLGSQLAHCLLTFGEISPKELNISTRRPETLSDLREKGVTCVRNNVEVAGSADILFLCVLPAHVHELTDEIKKAISRKTIVYSLVAGVPSTRLKLLLNCTNVVHPNYRWENPLNDNEWDFTNDVMGTFGNQYLLEKTCPLSLSTEPVVGTMGSFAEQLVYAGVNACTMMGLRRKETVDVINAVFLGHSSENPLKHKLQQTDIEPDAKSETFSLVDLSEITEEEDTKLRHKLMNNHRIRNAYVVYYCQLFKDYLDWKNQTLQIARKQIQFSFD